MTELYTIKIKDISKPIHELLDLDNLRLFSIFYHEYYNENFEDLSFVVFVDDRPLAYVPCHKIGDKLCYDMGPIDIFPLSEQSAQGKFFSYIIEHLLELKDEYKCKEFYIVDNFQNGRLSLLGVKLFNMGVYSKLTFEMRIPHDTFSESEYFSKLRKRYKSWINYGKKNFQVRFMNKDIYNEDLFYRFKEFHHVVSGRKTRSDESWEAQLALVREGYGELVTCFDGDKLIAGCLNLDDFLRTHYYTGVYDRSLFDKGIAHYPLYLGITRSSKRNEKGWYTLGYIDSFIGDKKISNIQFFKKGFCRDLTPAVIWSSVPQT